jgi:catechol 2,3-dioxygenase-like lactoylglutathione lyase family enzyme
MEITGLGWCGTRSERAAELAHFYQQVLGLRLVHQEAGLWVFGLPDGRHVEVFGSGYPGKDHFSTGPVVGFAVTNLAAATDELRRAGVELLGDPGSGWQHFRGARQQRLRAGRERAADDGLARDAGDVARR